MLGMRDEMLSQQGHEDKADWLEPWDVTFGGSPFGEMAQHIVILDPEEELGLSLGLTGVWPHFTIHFDDGFDDTF